MPLLLLTGYPCAGKTTRAGAVCTLLRDHLGAAATAQAPGAAKPTVLLLNDQTLHIPRSQYASKEGEGMARGHYLSAVQRHLSPNCFVVLDGMNYIKGFRYQLHCIAKEARTTFLCLHIAVPKERAAAWNQARIAATASTSGPSNGLAGRQEEAHPYYEPELLDALCYRYEEPNPFARWDTPLLTLVEGDDLATFFPTHILPPLVERAPPKPNLSTAPKALVPADYLGTVDARVQEVVDACIEHQRTSPTGGGRLRLPAAGASGTRLELALPDRALSVAELRRHKRQFLAMNKMHTLATEQVQPEFVHYLVRVLQEE